MRMNAGARTQANALMHVDNAKFYVPRHPYLTDILGNDSFIDMLRQTK